MLEAGVRKLIFSSSAAVYGAPRETPIPESHPLDPANPYGRTKAMVERILEDYDRAYGLSSVSLRYFNAAGADPDGEMGETPRPGDPPHPEHPPEPPRHGAPPGRLRRGLPHPGRDGRPGLHPRHRPGRGPRPGPQGPAPGRGERRRQPRHEHRAIPSSRSSARPSRSPGGPSPTTSAEAGGRRGRPPRLQGEGGKAPWLEAGPLLPRDDHRDGLGLAPEERLTRTPARAITMCQ